MRWLCALVVAGCGEYCEYSETMCDGLAILRCIESDGFADHTFGDLGGACELGETCVDIVDPAGMRHAVCSFSGEPDSRCSREGLGITHVCADGETVISCNSGYASDKRMCEGACVAPGGSAFCSLDAEPSPSCAIVPSSGCDEVTGEAAVIACRQGYETDRISCASDQSCVEAATQYRRAYCASDEPCTGTDTLCRDARRIEGCVAGRTVSMTCNEGTACEEFGVLGYDNRPTGATEAQCIRR